MSSNKKKCKKYIYFKLVRNELGQLDCGLGQVDPYFFTRV